MFRVFLALINLELALGLPEVYGIPSAGVGPTQEFHTQAVQPVEDHKLHFFGLQDHHEQEAGLPSSNQEQPISDTSPSRPTSQYGAPQDNRPLEDQSILDNSDKSLRGDQVHRTYNLQSFQDASNEELIASFKPQFVSRYPNEQESELEYANYAPYNAKSISSGTSKSDFPSSYSQPTQDAKYSSDQRFPATSQYNADSYQSARAQTPMTDISNGYNSQEVSKLNQQATGRQMLESIGNGYNSQEVSNLNQQATGRQMIESIRNGYNNQEVSNFNQQATGPQMLESFSNGFNNQEVSNLHQQATGRQMLESEVPSYPNYLDSQDIQKSVTETAFQSQPYPNPNYDAPIEVPQDARMVNPAYQTSMTSYQNAKPKDVVPEYTRPVQQAHYVSPSYSRLDAQNSKQDIENREMKAPRIGSTYGVPAIESSDYRDSLVANSPYKSSGASNQAARRQQYDSSASGQRYESPNTQQKAPAYQEGGYARQEAQAQRDSVVGGQNYRAVGDQNYRAVGGYEAPMRYIAVYQTHRAPGRPDISTASYLTQPLQNQQQTQVLPISPIYHRESPIGSISSTLISKDVGAYQPQPAYIQPLYWEKGRVVAPAVSNVNIPLPQSSYGLPNF